MRVSHESLSTNSFTTSSFSYFLSNLKLPLLQCSAQLLAQLQQKQPVKVTVASYKSVTKDENPCSPPTFLLCIEDARIRGAYIRMWSTFCTWFKLSLITI